MYKKFIRKCTVTCYYKKRRNNNFIIISNSHDYNFLVYLQPKTRPTTVFPSRYASLPSSTPKPNVEIDQQQQASGNGVYIGRDFIGIKINDVHNAVLKSGARMPGKLDIFLFFHLSYLNIS